MSFRERWHQIEHWGSQHPVLLGLGIFIVGAIVLFIFLPRKPAPESGAILAQPQGPSDAYYGYQASLAEQGNRLAIATLETQAASDIAGKELTGLQTKIAGDVTIAGMQYQTIGHVAELQQAADLSQIAASAHSQDLASTLSAQVAQGAFDRDINLASINAAAVTEQARIGSSTALGIANYQAQIANSTIAAQLQGLFDTNASQVDMARIAGQAYIGGRQYDLASQAYSQGVYRTLQGFSGDALGNIGLNLNPPAIENIPYRELFERAGEQSATGTTIRQYLGIS